MACICSSANCPDAKGFFAHLTDEELANDLRSVRAMVADKSYSLRTRTVIAKTLQRLIDEDRRRSTSAKPGDQ